MSKLKEKFKILGHNIREIKRNLTVKDKKYKARFLVLSCLIITGLILGIKLISASYARYYSKKAMKLDVVAALYILDEGEYKFDMDIEGILPSSEEYTYLFTVANFKDNKTSNVDLEYTMKIVTTTNLPLNYKLYKNENPGTNLLTSKEVKQDESNAWYNVFTLNTPSLFKYNTKTTDSYYLVVNFPEAYKNNLEYANKIESVTVIVNSKQVI